MWSCIIIDDEAQGIQALTWKIEEYLPALKVSATFLDPAKALDEIPKLNFDLLFLDIDMPGMTGFELLEKLKQPSFATIFVTAHNDYVLKALRCSALDYLVKPVDAEELQAAFIRFQSHQKEVNYNELYQLLHNNLNTQSPRRIALPTSESISYIEESSILFCESDSNYTTLKLTDGRQLVISRTLKKTGEMLSDHFVRVHHSFLVNLQHVDAYYRGSGGSIKMKDGSMIPVSKSRREQVLERLRN